jgi:FxLD family lantipeptide
LSGTPGIRTPIKEVVVSIPFGKTPVAPTQAVQVQQDADFGEWDLDVSIVESGPAADQLIRMTDDGCNSTCATACTSCP